MPAGVVFIGGGCAITKLEDLSKSLLKLPSRIGTTDFFGNMKTKLRDPSWYVALGLIISSKNTENSNSGSFGGLLKDLKNSIKSMTKQLMP